MKKTISRRHSATFPSCLRPISAADPPTSTTATTATNLTTCLYHTRLGIFALTWSRSLLRRSLHLHLLPHHHHRRRPLSSSSSFRLNLNPFLFWNKRGSGKLPLPSASATVFWDLTHAKFRSGTEPESGFYITVLVDGEIVLLVGDLDPHSQPEPKLGSGSGAHQQALVLRREHVNGTKLHRTKALFGGKSRAISIECDDSDPDPELVIRVDEEKVLEVKHLKWKFRGGERIEIDGQPILLSWDVYNWLFDEGEKGEGFALFTFRFEIERGDAAELGGGGGERVLLEELPAERGWRRKKRGWAMKARSLSASSLSSASSSACGSVLDWESVEETELKGPTGFSLLVYAWKS